MQSDSVTKPDFLLIGAQKSGTTWLWKMLDQHPGTDLPQKKEIHYFGGVEKYRKGKEWYYSHFKELDSSKVIGEASTTYLYDTIPYWYNSSSLIEFDPSLPPIPEIIKNELPDIKILVILRDPVWRAVSAFKHWMNRMKRNGPSPFLGLKKVALQNPKMRILEYGYYARYLKLWKEFFSPKQIKLFIFENDVVNSPERMLHDVYHFLRLDSNFLPKAFYRSVHSSRGISRIILNYYADPFTTNMFVTRTGKLLDRFDFLRPLAIKRSDIEFLRSVYLPERQELERITGRDLGCWDYGERHG